MLVVASDTTGRVGRGRRSARLAVAAAAIVAIGASVTACTSPTPTPAPTPTNAGTPSPTFPSAGTPNPTSGTGSGTTDVEPTDVPAAAMLQQADVPAGYRYDGEDTGSHWSLEFTHWYCAAPNNLTGVPPAGSSRGAAFRGTAAQPGGFLELVDRRSVAQAQSYLQAVRRMAQGCAPVNVPVTWTILREGFAGDESLNLKVNIDGVITTYIVVRAGGLVAQVAYEERTLPDPTQLGQRVAARLCEGTTAC